MRAFRSAGDSIAGFLELTEPSRSYRFNAAMPFSTIVIDAGATSWVRRWMRKRLPSRLGT